MLTWISLMLTLAVRISLIVGAGFLVGSWLAGLVRASLNRTRLDPIVRELIASLVQPVIIVIAALGAMSHVGVDLTGAVALLGAAGIGIGLAMKDSLSGIAAGAMLLTIRPFDGGDSVEVAGQAGSVVEFDLLTLTLRTADGVLVTLPNTVVLKSPIRNNSRHGTRRVEITWSLQHSADVAGAVEMLAAAMTSDERVLAEPPPVVVVTDVDPAQIKVTARAWVHTSDLGNTRSDLIIAMKQGLITAGVPLADASALLAKLVS